MQEVKKNHFKYFENSTVCNGPTYMQSYGKDLKTSIFSSIDTFSKALG